MKSTSILALLAVAGPIFLGCNDPAPEGMPADKPSLKSAFDGDFLIGAALNPEQFYGRDSLGAALVRQQFNSITPENVMKWEVIHPEPDRYDFTDADRYVDFGEENGMFVVGHTLVWHSQTPHWVFENEDGSPASRDTLIARMEDHIRTVVGRYKGRVKGWDVVNEALNEDGSLRDSPWRRIIGDDFLSRAFRLVHEVDPDAELYYNDYSLANADKAKGAARIVQNMLDEGLTVTGIGMQGHYKMDWPTAAEVDSSITLFRNLGVNVMFTELDIDLLPRATQNTGADVSMSADAWEELNPYEAGLPESLQTALAERYGALFGVFMKHKDAVTRVTFWGVRDSDSWLNGWPVRGRTSYPLLFGRDGAPKPAMKAVLATAAEK